MNYLTDQQQAAIHLNNGNPASWINPETFEVMTILKSEEYDRARGLVDGLPDVEQFLDAATQTEFVLLSQQVYGRIKAFFEEDWPTKEERLSQLREFGNRAGWADPEMDAYEEYRKKP